MTIYRILVIFVVFDFVRLIWFKFSGEFDTILFINVLVTPMSISFMYFNSSRGATVVR